MKQGVWPRGGDICSDGIVEEGIQPRGGGGWWGRGAQDKLLLRCFSRVGTMPLGQHLYPTTASILLPTAPYMGKLTVSYST